MRDRKAERERKSDRSRTHTCIRARKWRSCTTHIHTHTCSYWMNTAVCRLTHTHAHRIATAESYTIIIVSGFRRKIKRKRGPRTAFGKWKPIRRCKCKCWIASSTIVFTKIAIDSPEITKCKMKYKYNIWQNIPRALERNSTVWHSVNQLSRTDRRSNKRTSTCKIAEHTI